MVFDLNPPGKIMFSDRNTLNWDPKTNKNISPAAQKNPQGIEGSLPFSTPKNINSDTFSGLNLHFRWSKWGWGSATTIEPSINLVDLLSQV